MAEKKVFLLLFLPPCLFYLNAFLPPSSFAFLPPLSLLQYLSPCDLGILPPLLYLSLLPSFSPFQRRCRGFRGWGGGGGGGMGDWAGERGGGVLKAAAATAAATTTAESKTPFLLMALLAAGLPPLFLPSLLSLRPQSFPYPWLTLFAGPPPPTPPFLARSVLQVREPPPPRKGGLVGLPKGLLLFLLHACPPYLLGRRDGPTAAFPFFRELPFPFIAMPPPPPPPFAPGPHGKRRLRRPQKGPGPFVFSPLLHYVLTRGPRDFARLFERANEEKLDRRSEGAERP